MIIPHQGKRKAYLDVTLVLEGMIPPRVVDKLEEEKREKGANKDKGAVKESSLVQLSSRLKTLGGTAVVHMGENSSIHKEKAVHLRICSNFM